MVCNVYGSPVTDGTMTRLERARFALQYKNEGNKEANARRYVEEMWRKIKDDGTQCLIYNATGAPITIAAARDASGKITKSPYPIIIQNGQWGVYLHGHMGTIGCVSSVAYAGEDAKGNKCQYVLSWRQVNKESTNRCFSEIRRAGYYTTNHGQGEWNILDKVVQSAGTTHHVIERGCKISASISPANANSPVFVATFTLEDA